MSAKNPGQKSGLAHGKTLSGCGYHSNRRLDQRTFPKIRGVADTGKEPLFWTIKNTIAMVSDDDLKCPLPVLKGNAVEVIVGFILALRETV